MRIGDDFPLQGKDLTGMAKHNDEKITGLQKAAILLITLGPEKSANVFKHLKEEEIEELTLEIANT